MNSEIEIIKNEDGCPCSNDCCNKPELFCPEHECPNDPKNDWCSACYVLECENCGDSCGHNE